MHELAIAESVVAAVLEYSGDRTVKTVRLKVGPFCGVVPDALDFCFDLAARGTRLEGAALEIDKPVGRAACRTCGEEFTLTDPILLCPCGSADVAVLAGRELAVTSVEVA